MSSIIRTDALRTNPEAASGFYDAVIVGSGVAARSSPKSLPRAVSAS